MLFQTLSPALYLVRLLHGVAETMLYSALFTYAADIVPPSRTAQGLGLFGVSAMLAITVGGVLLERISAIPIVRHVKVKGRASPDDPTLKAYWDSRRCKMGRQRVAKGSTLYGIAEAQRWQCPGCGQALFDGQEVHLHHLIPVHAGGSDKRENLQWLHAACHRQRHRQGVTAGQSA